MKLKVQKLFTANWPARAGLGWGDLVVMLGLIVLVGAGVRFAAGTPRIIHGATVSLRPEALPAYAALSLARMSVAFACSFVFALVYGYVAANSRRAERIMLPLLDVLQSVPLLSFLPVILLSLNSLLPSRLAAELASILLIFTCQVWNLILTWYQSLTSVPRDLNEASKAFKFDRWLRLKTVQLPFGANGLVWNSMVSWAGGWFFLMASETFTLGDRDFRLPGIGSYLHEAANQGNMVEVLRAAATLIFIITALDQLAWRPLVSWCERFRVGYNDRDVESSSWVLEVFRNSRLVRQIVGRVTKLFGIAARKFLAHYEETLVQQISPVRTVSIVRALCSAVLAVVVVGGLYAAAQFLVVVSFGRWLQILTAVAATFGRVFVSLLLALVWTVPLGVLIGSSLRLGAWLQPIVQIAASFPSTALFPVLLLVLLPLPGGLNVAAISLMTMGSQWYLLFNVIAGARTIPKELNYTTALLRMSWVERWRSLVLPTLFPFVITGGITASGGAWNASVVAEYVHFGGDVEYTTGIGALIALSTERGDYPMLFASTLGMIVTVVLINRLVWRRLFVLAEERYRME